MYTNFRPTVALAAMLLLAPVLALAKTPATPEKLNQLIPSTGKKTCRRTR